MHGKKFFVSAIWNLAGAILPLLAGLATIPVLSASLGVERFGLLNLAWLLIGYFSLFDLGIGRALTRLVAEMIAREDARSIPGLAGTALGMTLWLGIAAAAGLAIAAPWLVGWIKISAETRDEALIAIWILAATLPFVLLSAGWRGVLEAYGRFDWANWVRIPLGIAFFVAPLMVLPFADGLVPVVAALAVARVVAWWFFRHFCYRANPELRAGKRIRREYLAPLLSFGGWMTVSNVISPLMVYADRFLIGGLLSAVAVAYYATPYEIVSRLWIVPGALTGVMFPAVAGKLLADRYGATMVYRRSAAIVLLVMLPACALFCLFAHEALDWWLGREYADNGYRVAQLLALGVFINSLGQVAVTVLHAAGRADWSAKLHLLELPAYLAILTIAANLYGIVGVALAWLLRMAIDTAVLVVLAERLLERSHRFAGSLIGGTTAAMLLLWMALSIESLTLRAILFAGLCAACAGFLPRQLRALTQETGRSPRQEATV